MQWALALLGLALLLGQGVLVWLFFRRADRARDAVRAAQALREQLAQLAEASRGARQETRADFAQLTEAADKRSARLEEALLARLRDQQAGQLAQLDSFAGQLARLAQMNEQKLEGVRQTLERQLSELRADNAQKLEEMRRTVDEKLHATLEQRLGESFRLVGQRLEAVHKGLGEMQTLAAGVGDLRRVLLNVKTRGIWGEMQLGRILEQVLTPEQYAQNVATVPKSSERVEFAVRLPGRGEAQQVVWLPIDAKFPQEDYERLLDARERADAQAAEAAGKALETRLKAEAKSIAEKYVEAPYTTEFALLFLPVEGLYAEALGRPGLCEFLMRRYKVVVAGPTTLAALLNSLQMGFQSVAIERRSAEVWALLGAVKTEFGKFGDLLEKTQKKLLEAGNSIDAAARKSRTIERRLGRVQQLPQGATPELPEELEV